MENRSLFNRIKGGLYGVAAGDALGGTTEFMSVKEIEAAYGYLTEIVGGGVWRLEPGEVTDDTMMTLCVADGILNNADDPLSSIGDEFLKWCATSPKDIGNIIRQVFRSYNGDWFEAACAAHEMLGQSAGNGSLMRCLPVALAYPEPAKVERITRLQSRMTHYDSRCDEACLIYNRIASLLLRGEELRQAIKLETAGTAYEWQGGGTPNCEPGGFVVHTFKWVLYLLMESNSFSEVVQRAANLGNDSDTIGAIAGGLAGIYYGYDGIPSRYSKAIIIRERLNETAIRLLSLHR